eukprot:402271_1
MVPPISIDSVVKLNTKYLNYLELHVALECAKQFNIHNPYILILSFKRGNDNIFDTKDSEHHIVDQILKPGNYSIIHNKTHKEAKHMMMDIIKQVNQTFDGIVTILLAVVRLSNINRLRDNGEYILKYYYDINNEKRHVDKLTKDIHYRLWDTQNYYLYWDISVVDCIDIQQQRPPNKYSNYQVKLIKQKKMKNNFTNAKAIIRGYCRQENQTDILFTVSILETLFKYYFGEI